MKKTYDICLLYDKVDYSKAEFIARRLKARNIDVFFDEWELIPGQPTVEGIEEAIVKSKVIGIVFGSNGIKGSFKEQVSAASSNRQANHKGIIPILIPGLVRLPDGFKRYAPIRFKNDINEDEPFINLIAGIREISPAELLDPLVSSVGEILIVDDVPRDRNDYYKGLDREWPGNVQAVKNTQEALDCLERSTPKIITVDLIIDNKEENGLELIQILNAKYPYIKILVISQLDNENIISKLSTLMIHGFISKHELIDINQLVEAIKALARGERCFSYGILNLMKHLSSLNDNQPPLMFRADENHLEYLKLGPRVSAVFNLLGEYGYKNKMIGSVLSMQETRVVRHIHHLFEVFHVQNRIQLRHVWNQLHNFKDLE